MDTALIASLGGGILGTVLLFSLADFLTTCEACFKSGDGGLGSWMMVGGSVILAVGLLLPKLLRARKPALEDESTT